MPEAFPYQYCALGAIKQVSRGRPLLRRKLITKLARTIGGDYAPRYATIVTFNDTHGKQEVLQQFDKAMGE